MFSMCIGNFFICLVEKFNIQKNILFQQVDFLLTEVDSKFILYIVFVERALLLFFLLLLL